MKKNLRRVMLSVCLLLLLCTTTVLADMRPPLPPGGGSIHTNEDTRVQMVAETVLLEIQQEEAYDRFLGKDVLQYVARVTAEFTMQNQGDETEIMLAAFPMTSVDPGMSYVDDLIDDFSVVVEGEPVLWQEKEHELCPYVTREQPCTWARFQVEFPPQELVHVTINYRSYLGDVGAGLGFKYATYVLVTGAAWFGTIGDAEIILQLPYEVSEEVVLDLDHYPEEVHYPTNEPVFDGNQVRWQYEDFEPDRNWGVYFADPDLWMRVEELRGLLADDPENAELWGELGGIYWSMCTMKGWLETKLIHFGLLAVDAYAEAVELDPENPYYHGGYADALYGIGQYELYLDESIEKIELALAQYRLAEEYGEGVAGDLFGEWKYIQYDIEDLLTEFNSRPTKTPTMTATNIPTKAVAITATEEAEEPDDVVVEATPSPTRTKIKPTVTATAEPEDTSFIGGLKISQFVSFGILIVLVLAGVVIFFKPKGKKKERY